MNHLSDYLVKFKKTLLKGQEIREGVVNILREILGVEILTRDVEVKGKKVKITAHSVIKNEIKLKKDKIIFKINKVLGSGVIEEIF
jgi:hypothetical protein